MTSLILERDTARDGSLAAASAVSAEHETALALAGLAAAAEEQTGELWRDYSARGGRPQRDRLVLHCAPLVRHVASRVRGGLPAHVEVADLVQCGVFGLIDAIERY